MPTPNPFKDLRKFLQEPRNRLFFTVVYATLFAWVIFPVVQYFLNKDLTAKYVEINTIPYESLVYNNHNLILESIENTSSLSFSGFGYTPSIKITIDASELTEKDIYWILKEERIKIKCIISSKSNNIDSYKLLSEAKFDSGKLIFDIHPEETVEWEKAFEDLESILRIDVMQDTLINKRVNGVNITTNKVNSYYCVSQYDNRNSV